VRGLLKKATEQKDLLVGRGMSEQLLDDLNAALVQFEQTLEATRAALHDHVGASSDMKEVVAEMVQQVRLLDGAGALSVRRQCRADGGVAQRPQRAGSGPVAR